MSEERRLVALTDEEREGLLALIELGESKFFLSGMASAKAALRRVGPTVEEAALATNGSPLNSDWNCEHGCGWRPESGHHSPDCPARAAGEDHKRVVEALRALGEGEDPPERTDTIAVTEQSLKAVRDERYKQLGMQGYTLERDQRYTKGHLIYAAAAYLLSDDQLWPWDMQEFKPDAEPASPIMTSDWDLLRATALLVAEMDRRRVARGETHE